MAPGGRAALLCAIKDQENAGALILVYNERARRNWPMEPLDVALGSGRVTWAKPFFVQQQSSLAGVRFQVYSPKEPERVARFFLSGAERAGVRGDGGVLTLWDDRGRIRVVDLTQRVVLRDLRL